MRVIYDDDVMERFAGFAYYYPEHKYSDVYLNHISNPFLVRVKKDAVKFMKSIGIDENEEEIVVVYRLNGKNVAIFRNLDTYDEFFETVIFLDNLQKN